MTNRPVPPARDAGIPPLVLSEDQNELGLGEVVRILSLIHI